MTHEQADNVLEYVSTAQVSPYSAPDRDTKLSVRAAYKYCCGLWRIAEGLAGDPFQGIGQQFATNFLGIPETLLQLLLLLLCMRACNAA